MEKSIKLEDILFWLLIMGIIAVVIWMLHGSPPTENGLLIITIFVATSEVLLWRVMFNTEKKSIIGIERLDKKSAISFERVRNQLGNIQKDIKEIKLLIKR